MYIIIIILKSKRYMHEQDAIRVYHDYTAKVNISGNICTYYSFDILKLQCHVGDLFYKYQVMHECIYVALIMGLHSMRSAALCDNLSLLQAHV